MESYLLSIPPRAVIQMSDLFFRGQPQQHSWTCFLENHLFSRGKWGKNFTRNARRHIPLVKVYLTSMHCIACTCSIVIIQSILKTYQGKMIGLYVQFFYFCIRNFRIHFTFGTEHNIFTIIIITFSGKLNFSSIIIQEATLCVYLH